MLGIMFGGSTYPRLSLRLTFDLTREAAPDTRYSEELY